MVCVAPLTLAAGNKLSIEEIKSYVNGKKDSGTVDVNPEDTLKFKIKVENLYDDSVNDIEIQDIEIKVTIKDIDDGDDLEEEGDGFDLDASDSETETIEFEIPLEVDDDSFDVEIEITGDDGENSSLKHTITDSLTVRVKKENHEVVIRRAELTSPTLKCSRTTSLDTNIINMGTNEEEVVLKVTNSELELSKQTSFDLGDDPFDDDSKFSTLFTISVDKDADAGIYPITVRADYDGRTAEKVVELEIEECEKKEEKEEEEVVVTIEEEEDTTPELITGLVTAEPTETTEEKSSFLEGPGFIALIVGVDILIIVIGVALIFGLAKRK